MVLNDAFALPGNFSVTSEFPPIIINYRLSATERELMIYF